MQTAAAVYYGLRRRVFEQVEQEVIRPVDILDEDQQATPGGGLEENGATREDASWQAALRWIGHHAPVAVFSIFPNLIVCASIAATPSGSSGLPARRSVSATASSNRAYDNSASRARAEAAVAAQHLRQLRQ